MVLCAAVILYRYLLFYIFRDKASVEYLDYFAVPRVGLVFMPSQVPRIIAIRFLNGYNAKYILSLFLCVARSAQICML